MGQKMPSGFLSPIPAHIELVTGGASLGQGYETVMAQICADALGVDYRDVTVVHGQTDRIADGVGAHASRATVMTGSAAHDGSLKPTRCCWKRPQACCRRGLLRWRSGKAGSAGPEDDAGPSISLAEIARQTGGLCAEGIHRSEHMTYPYGVHIAQVASIARPARSQWNGSWLPTTSAAP